MQNVSDILPLFFTPSHYVSENQEWDLIPLNLVSALTLFRTTQPRNYFVPSYVDNWKHYTLNTTTWTTGAQTTHIPSHLLLMHTLGGHALLRNAWEKPLNMKGMVLSVSSLDTRY